MSPCIYLLPVSLIAIRAGPAGIVRRLLPDAKPQHPPCHHPAEVKPAPVQSLTGGAAPLAGNGFAPSRSSTLRPARTSVTTKERPGGRRSDENRAPAPHD